ncbi:IcmC (DotE) [Legionella sainthelensi]|uniref:type IV secretion protein IcmC n=1 Tax=Legionella sainthelensi TaxID=28087 RepID=UPI000F7157A6|nr:type IV secretion protein IcmC [Legionella sainthelensi]VEB35350.1 IcmC (DotE) [Legionella sainthelensi]
MADTCTGGTVACWISSQVNILNNVANNLLPVERLITGAAYLIGCAFLFKGVYSLKQYGEQRTMYSSNTNIKEPLTYLLIGTMLIYFPTTFSTFMQSTFGYQNVLEYAPVNSGNSTLNILFGSGSAVGGPLTIVIQVIGLIAFVRGWVLIARAASSGGQPGATAKGLIHVFGGILAINIVGTLEMFNNTLYGS